MSLNVFQVESYVYLAVAFVVLVVAIYAFVNSLLWEAEAYEAAGKLTKGTWTTILGIGVVLQVVPIGLFIISLIMFVAALVYLLDVRPALAGLRRR